MLLSDLYTQQIGAQMLEGGMMPPQLALNQESYPPLWGNGSATNPSMYLSLPVRRSYGRKPLSEIGEKDYDTD